MALNDHQEQMVYNAALVLMQEIGVISKDAAPSMPMLIYVMGEHASFLKENGDYRDNLIRDCFDALENRHADDLVDELKEKYGMEG